MASYLSLANAQTLLGRVLDIYKDANGNVDTDHLTLVIDEAENMVNTAIGSRYTVPVTDTYSVEYLRSIVVPIPPGNVRPRTNWMLDDAVTSTKAPDGGGGSASHSTGSTPSSISGSTAAKLA